MLTKISLTSHRSGEPGKNVDRKIIPLHFHAVFSDSHDDGHDDDDKTSTTTTTMTRTMATTDDDENDDDDENVNKDEPVARPVKVLGGL